MYNKDIKFDKGLTSSPSLYQPKSLRNAVINQSQDVKMLTNPNLKKIKKIDKTRILKEATTSLLIKGKKDPIGNKVAPLSKATVAKKLHSIPQAQSINHYQKLPKKPVGSNWSSA